MEDITRKVFISVCLLIVLDECNPPRSLENKIIPRSVPQHFARLRKVMRGFKATLLTEQHNTKVVYFGSFRELYLE